MEKTTRTRIIKNKAVGVSCSSLKRVLNYMVKNSKFRFNDDKHWSRLALATSEKFDPVDEKVIKQHFEKHAQNVVRTLRNMYHLEAVDEKKPEDDTIVLDWVKKYIDQTRQDLESVNAHHHTVNLQSRQALIIEGATAKNTDGQTEETVPDYESTLIRGMIGYSVDKIIRSMIESWTLTCIEKTVGGVKNTVRHKIPGNSAEANNEEKEQMSQLAVHTDSDKENAA